MAVHMRDGNKSEALRDFERYRSRLDAALGLKPTARLGVALGLKLTPRLRALPPG
jgi:hypothetical protein